MTPSQPLPLGVVTFLLTDVENSTGLWRDCPGARDAVARQEALIGDAIARHGGVRPRDQGEGDSLLGAFARPGDALAACRVPEVPGVPVDEVLLRNLERADTLLVLDNCEHLLDECARLVEAVLRAGTGVRVLATSREPLGAAGEVTWRIPSLPVAPTDERDPGRIGTFAAVRLFVERARAARPDFTLEAASAPVVARICRRLDGLPLALELAAARVRTLSIERLADGLDDRFRLLTGGARTALARQRTLLASVEWSHDLLDESERLLFRRLGVFASPFALEAAEAVASGDDLDRFAVLDVLGRLVDKSLVQLGGDRYRVLETLRQYALERAVAAGELAALRARHLAWFRRRAREWALDTEVATDEVLDVVGAELPDLLAALDWSLEEGDPAVEFLAPIAEYAVAREAYTDLGPVASRVLAALEDDRDAWLAALAPLAPALFLAAQVDWMPAAKRELEERGDALPLSVRGWIEWALAMPAAFDGRAEGFAGIRRAIELAHAAGARGLEFRATANLANLLSITGQPASAGPFLRWLERHAPPTASYRRLVDLAQVMCAAYAGDLAAARARLLANGWDHIGLLLAAAYVGLWTDDRALAEQALQQVEQRQVLGVFEGHATAVRANAAMLAGDLEGARAALRRGLDRPAMGMVHLSLRLDLADLALTLGDTEEAAALLPDIDRRLTSSDLVAFAGYADIVRARLAVLEHEFAAAAAAAHAALTRAEPHGLMPIVVDALDLLAGIAAAEGRLDEAGRLLGAVEALRDRTGYRRLERYHRHPFEAALASVDVACIEEGRRLTLAEAVAYARRGRGERGRPAHGWDSLTPAEARVVELVGVGLPNREIAARLFVSLATVKTHLVHVYGKLDVRTRAELAAAVARRGA